jgi:hypothetical protein
MMAMRLKLVAPCALGVLALCVSTPLIAQQDTLRTRTTSERTIMISKGEVLPVVRVDTVFLSRSDTILTTTTRVDTVTITTPPPIPVVLPRGAMFWGLYAGTTAPYRQIDRLYTKGFHAGGVLGWEPQRGFLGLRFDGGVSQFNREQGRVAALVGTGTSLMMHLAGDLKVKPLNFKGWSLYGIGGVNYNRYKRLALVADADEATHCGPQFDGKGGCYEAANDSEWSDKFGFNFGAGLDFHIGSQDMFIEARAVTIEANSARTWFVPVSLGVRYF